MKQNDPNKVGLPVKKAEAKNPRVKVIAKKAVAKKVTEVK